jgi:hypothetical protein
MKRDFGPLWVTDTASYDRTEVIAMTVQSQPAQPSAVNRGVGHVFDRQLAVCPACGSDQLEPVVERGSPDVHWLCDACSRCWHVELGYVHRITPPVCFGCSERERCEAVYWADQARAQRG